MSPPLFVILVTFSSTFTYAFQACTLFSTQPSQCYIPLKHRVDHPKRKQNFSLPFQPGCHLSIQESTTEVLYSKSSDHIIPRFKNYYIPQQPPKPQQQPSCPTHCAEPTSNTPFTGCIGQRHEKSMSDICPPKLEGEMLPSHSGIQLKQLNIRNLTLAFSWPFLGTVLMNVFLWLLSATQLV